MLLALPVDWCWNAGVEPIEGLGAGTNESRLEGWTSRLFGRPLLPTADMLAALCSLTRTLLVSESS